MFEDLLVFVMFLGIQDTVSWTVSPILNQRDKERMAEIHVSEILHLD